MEYQYQARERDYLITGPDGIQIRIPYTGGDLVTTPTGSFSTAPSPLDTLLRDRVLRALNGLSPDSELPTILNERISTAGNGTASVEYPDEPLTITYGILDNAGANFDPGNYTITFNLDSLRV